MAVSLILEVCGQNCFKFNVLIAAASTPPVTRGEGSSHRYREQTSIARTPYPKAYILLQREGMLHRPTRQKNKNKNYTNIIKEATETHITLFG